MKIKSIKKVGKRPVYDISVKDVAHYVLENGVITHNTGSYYNSDNIWIIGRQQEKEGDELAGYNFVINVEKSRYVKEKSKIVIGISFEGGINRWSGLYENALEMQYVVPGEKKGWMMTVDPETGELSKNRRKDDIVNDSVFWKRLLKTDKFKKAVEEKYSLAMGPIISDEEVRSTLESITDD